MVLSIRAQHLQSSTNLSNTQHTALENPLSKFFSFTPLREDFSEVSHSLLSVLSEARNTTFENLNRRFCPPEHPEIHSTLREVLKELQEQVLTKHFVHENTLNMMAGVLGAMSSSLLTSRIAFKPLAWGLKIALTHLITSRLNEKLQGHKSSLPNVRDIGGVVNVGSSEAMNALLHPLLASQSGNPLSLIAIFLLSRVSATLVMTLASMLETKVGNLVGYSHEDWRSHYNARAITHTFCMDLAMVSGNHLAARVSSTAFRATAAHVQTRFKNQIQQAKDFFLNPHTAQNFKRAFPLIAGVSLAIAPFLSHNTLSGINAVLGLGCLGITFQRNFIEERSIGIAHRRSELKLGDKDFLPPNEQQPLQVAPILAEAPEGVLVSVGSDRVNFNDVLHPKFTDIIAADYCDDIVLFHSVNRLLLRASPPKDRNFYYKLRVKAKHEEWKEAATQALELELISPEDHAVLHDPEVFGWWEENISKDERWNSLYEASNQFESVNYLLDDAAFSQIQQRALGNHFFAENIDFGNKEHVDALVAHLKAQGKTVSVLDLSNAWENEFPNNYLGCLKTAYVLEKFGEVMSPEGIVIFTMGGRISKHETNIVYHGYRYKAIRAYAESISSWTKQVTGMDWTVQRLSSLITTTRDEAMRANQRNIPGHLFEFLESL